MLANMQGFDAKQHLVNHDDMLDLDKWIVSKTADLQVQILQGYDEYNFHHVMQLILNFCTNDLGGFYLDVIKDRQYTTGEDSLARRSAQSALYHIAQAMVRWLAPVLSFTAEEIWQTLEEENSESIFLQDWYQGLNAGYENDSIETARQINPAIRKQMEGMRSDKIIGSSLDAEIDVYCSDEIYQSLSKLGDELRFVFITSYARIHPISEQADDCVEAGAGVMIKVSKSEHEKCVRCWHHRADVASHDEHPELCGRCVENIAGDGEQRVFA
ncbi:MAG TPA: isoleucine--tRNA ligase, partial [Gammaproteobacteria bacterium]|nr:isoleucine--tRNA ligase [Gammaproteobacteria bacterium]